jgi:hypothetical protein
MYKSIKILAVLTFIALFSGCASVNKMPLNETVKEIDTSQKSILLGRITIQNKNKPNHQPELLAVFVKKDGKDFSFTKPSLISEVDNESKEYIFSLASEPGVAELSLMRFLRQAFLISGMADLQFKQEITFPENEIVYIGNINASIIPREEGQPRAGSVIPLIDQSVTGFSSGTFVVEISDNYDEDIKLITEKFPYLVGKNITKMILPEWEYPKDNANAESSK